MTRWYRAYEGTVTDAKLGEVALVAGVSRSVAIAAWHCILESASSANGGGVFHTSARRVAVILVEPVDTIQRVFDELIALGMIAGDVIVAWSKRQYESDSSTERSRKSRERAKTVPSTQRNADATLQQHHATVPDTDTDTDTDKKDLLAKARVRGQFDVFWSVYPRRLAKGAAEKAWKAAIKKHMPDKIIESARIFAAQQFGKDQQYIAHPATWLNQERWNDEPQLTIQTQFSGPNNAKPTQNSKSRFTTAANELRSSLGLGEDYESSRYDPQAGP